MSSELDGQYLPPDPAPMPAAPARVPLSAEAQAALGARPRPRPRPRQRRGRGGRLVLGGALVGVVGAVGIGGWLWLQPADVTVLDQVLPASTVGYVRVDLDPSAQQKVQAARLRASLAAGSEADQRAMIEQLAERLTEALGAQGVDAEAVLADLRVVMGNTLELGMAALDEGSDNGVVLLAAKDESTTRAAIERILAAARTVPAQGEVDPADVAVASRSGWLVIGPSAAVATVTSSAVSLAATGDAAPGLERLPGDRVAEFWVRARQDSPTVAGAVALTAQGVAFDAYTVGRSFASLMDVEDRTLPAGGLLARATDSTRTYVATRGDGIVAASDANVIELALGAWFSGDSSRMLDSTGAPISQEALVDVLGSGAAEARDADTVVAFVRGPLAGITDALDELATMGAGEALTDEERNQVSQAEEALESLGVVVTADHLHAEVRVS